MLDNIKSLYILKAIFTNLSKRKYLCLIIHNKKLQSKLNISIDTYIKYYNQIEIEIIPDKNQINNNNKFINIMDERDKSFYHIYFNNENVEIKRNYFTINEDVSKIKVLIDMEVKSIEALFYECYSIKEIKFIKFNRTDFNNYQYMFYYCLNLKNIDIKKLKTNNVENMDNMFFLCETLEKLDLSNFITDKVKRMYKMFEDCLSLKELNISNFKFNESTDIEYMFSNCPKELKKKIKYKYNDIDLNAFFNFNYFDDEFDTLDLF